MCRPVSSWARVGFSGDTCSPCRRGTPIMLDALKGLTGGGKAQKQSDDLQSLIAAAKEERSALSTMLTQISMRSAKLSQLGKSLEQVDQKATTTTEKLDEI